MASPLYIALTVLDVSSFVSHFIGTYLMVKAYEPGREDSQHIFLTSLAVSEMFMSIFQLLFTWIPKRMFPTINMYLKVVQFFFFSTMYYLSMILITIDRFLDIRLNIKYPIYWNGMKTKILLFVMWSLTGCFTFSLCLVFYFRRVSVTRHSYYLFLSLDLIFVFVSILTYAYIFSKYKRSCEAPAPGFNSNSISVFTVFRKSRRFYIILLLVITFFLFTVIPDIIIFFAVTLDDPNLRSVRKQLIIPTCRILYAISRLVDAYAYIFMDNRIRKLILYRSNQIHSTNVRNVRSQTNDAIAASEETS